MRHPMSVMELLGAATDREPGPKPFPVGRDSKKNGRRRAVLDAGRSFLLLIFNAIRTGRGYRRRRQRRRAEAVVRLRRQARRRPARPCRPDADNAGWPWALPMSAPVPAQIAPPPNTPRSVLDMDEQPQASSTGRTATPRRRRVFIDQLLSVPLIGRGQSAGRLRKAVLF